MFLGLMVQALFLPLLVLFNPTPILTHSGYLLSTLGVIIGFRSLKEISFSAFLGLSSPSKETENHLVIRGLYSLVRHPLYLGIVLIFLGYFLVSGTVGALIHLFCLLIYLPIGIYFEERNLLKKYGSLYEDYLRRIPAILPFKTKKGL
jgi:protein-S-isoprenylcysteine O-methyltransferase Ste14